MGASLEWVTVVQDLFLEGASPARIAESLDGKPTIGDGYVIVRSMRAIEGLDATILVRHARAVTLSVWYRDLEKPTLADAEAMFGVATRHPNRLFDLVFETATRPLDHGGTLVISCSASGEFDAREQRLLTAIALTVQPGV